MPFLLMMEFPDNSIELFFHYYVCILYGNFLAHSFRHCSTGLPGSSLLQLTSITFIHDPARLTDHGETQLPTSNPTATSRAKPPVKMQTLKMQILLVMVVVWATAPRTRKTLRSCVPNFKTLCTFVGISTKTRLCGMTCAWLRVQWIHT